MLRKLLCVTLVFTFVSLFAVFLSFQQVAADDNAEETTTASGDGLDAAPTKSAAAVAECKSGGLLDSFTGLLKSLVPLSLRGLLG